MSAIRPQQILNLEMSRPNDANAETIREYLACLLITLWKEGESFNGKRPLGNSAWEFDLYHALVKGGLVEGTFDEDGHLDEFPQSSQKKANMLIEFAIRSLGSR